MPRMAGRPFISFVTDFGVGSSAPAVCRGVMLDIAPDARLVDVTHGVRHFAVREGAFLLARSVPYFPVGVHVAVVDPGVGTERRPIALQAARGDFLVGPDNGLLVPAAKALGGIVAARALENRALVGVTAAPDGRSLVMQTNLGAAGAGDLLILRLGVDSGPSPLLATRFGESYAAVSPDGRWLAYVSNESGSDQVYVRPYPNVADARWQVSVNGGYAPRWARSGRELFYVSRPEGRVGDLIAVQVQLTPTFAAGRAQTLFSFSAVGQDLYDVAPDDRRFLTIEAAGSSAAGAGELILVQHFFEELKAKVGR